MRREHPGWVCIINLPSPSGAQKRCGALHPDPINLRLISSGDSSRRQPLLQPYVPEACSGSGSGNKLPRHVTRPPLFFSVPLPSSPTSSSTRSCQRSSVWPCQGVCVPGLRLSPAGRENPGPLCQPCGETFLDDVCFCRRADPDRQSDDGRPLLFGRPCRRVCVSALSTYSSLVYNFVNVCVCSPSSAALAYHPTHA